MRIAIILTSVAVLISLTGCSSMRGNVVPQSGPTMEQVYDGAGEQVNLSEDDSHSNKNNLTIVRKKNNVLTKASATSMTAIVSTHAVSQEFHRLPNPEIKMYVYPHLAGLDQVPVPGYFTAFNVYDHDYYALPQE